MSLKLLKRTLILKNSRSSRLNIYSDVLFHIFEFINNLQIFSIIFNTNTVNNMKHKKYCCVK